MSNEPRSPRGPFTEAGRVSLPSPLARVPRGQRRAEVVCSRVGASRPTVAAIVHGESVTDDRMTFDLGANFALVGCRCGVIHLIDGRLLRAAVVSAPRASGRVPVVDLARVTMD